MTLEILDPTHETDSADFRAADRLATISGTRIAIVSNGKHGTKPFFDALEAELKGRHGAAEVVRIIKPNYSAPVDRALLGDAEKWNALIAGIGD